MAAEQRSAYANLVELDIEPVPGAGVEAFSGQYNTAGTPLELAIR